MANYVIISSAIGVTPPFSGTACDVYGNNWVGPFYLNVIDNDFENNSFGEGVYDNTIGTNFKPNCLKYFHHIFDFYVYTPGLHHFGDVKL